MVLKESKNKTELGEEREGSSEEGRDEGGWGSVLLFQRPTLSQLGL